MFKAFLFSLLLPALSFAQTETDSTTGSNVSAEDARIIVEHHNMARKEVGVQPLAWSDTLAEYAQEWADLLAKDCSFRHRQQGKYGENIYSASSSASFQPLKASQAWYAEKQRFTYAKIGEPGTARAMHYTQMIWKNTTEVGVGMAVCANGAVIVVANYNPPGNYTGEPPY